MARTKKADIQAKIAQINKLNGGGMPVLQACKKVGMAYVTLLRHRGKASISHNGRKTEQLYKQLVEAIREEVREEIRQKLGQV